MYCKYDVQNKKGQNSILCKVMEMRARSARLGIAESCLKINVKLVIFWERNLFG